MSIATQIQRLQLAKSDIIDAIETKGILVPSGSTMDDMAELILKIGEETGDLGPIYTSYIIDLTPTMSNSTPPTELSTHLPEDMIIGKAAKDCDETVEINGETVYKNVIRRIRANSHCYLSRHVTNALWNYTLKLWLLSDNDKLLLKDGVTDIYDIYNSSDCIFQNTDNIVMKLPKFWWKIELLDLDGFKFKVSFCMSEDDVDNTWNLWDDKICIGVYKASNSSGTITSPNNAYNDPVYYYSHSYEKVVTNADSLSFLMMAAAQPNYCSAMDFEVHQVMMLLGFGWYSTTEIERYIGNASFCLTTGAANGWGMSDSSLDYGLIERYNSDYSVYLYNNFWGLENWIGGGYEIMPWIRCNRKDYNNTFPVYITERDNDNEEISTTLDFSNDILMAGCLTKFKLINNKYLIPSLFRLNSNYNRGYASYGKYRYGKITYATRAGLDTITGGLAYLNFEDLADSMDSLITSRLVIRPTSYVTIQLMN